ncbi:hypothetical protein B9Z48_20510 [Limnohabitans sp. WS1]|nr:hypothetical protein B9Z48_20510 [Limnohabitans sp. WS1]
MVRLSTRLHGAPGALLFALVRYSMPTPTDANARPRKWPRKVPPFAPLSAALLTLWVWLARLCGVCGA